MLQMEFRALYSLYASNSTYCPFQVSLNEVTFPISSSPYNRHGGGRIFEMTSWFIYKDPWNIYVYRD